jgi:xylulokinase
VHKFLLIEEWLIYSLTGRFVAEGSLLCSTTWRDLRAKRYWPRMLARLYDSLLPVFNRQ